jgi:NAD(P)-dependent dehydrogenase (short-subunit alcohol dehydrogenase family)
MPSSRLKLQFDKNSTYVLAGGLGGLGRCVAHWMVNRGARNLVFLSRSGVQKEESRNLVKELTAEGARIAAYACDVGDEDRLRLVLRDVSKNLPPIRGVIQGAMVLQVCLILPHYFLTKLGY